MALVPGAVMAQSTSVTDAHIQQINQQFAQKGVPNGFVALDSYGRLELKGDYEDEMQVDRAFSIAQTVVGVKWVSPVTPENIKVKEWERKLGSLFSRAAVLKPQVRGDAPVGPVRNRYALVVGVGKFKNGITPLQYSVRDATLFYRFLLEQAGFTKNNTYFLADQNATSSNVVKYLNGIRNAAQEDDLVVVYMSSHGTPPDKFGGVYIVTYDTEVNPRERVWHTSVAESALKDFVENLRARRLVMVLDTCYSNGAYRAIPGFLPPGGKSLGVGDENEGYGVSTAQGKRLFGAKDIVLEDQPRQAASIGEKHRRQPGVLRQGPHQRKQRRREILGIGPTSQQRLYLLFRGRDEALRRFGEGRLRLLQTQDHSAGSAGEGGRHHPDPPGHGHQ